jgi:dienelactone hydrolase
VSHPHRTGSRCRARWLLAAPTPKSVGRGYFQLITGSAEQTVSQVVDHLETLPEIDAGRIGIVGTSTNGFKVLQAFAAEPRLAAAVAVAACGDYHHFLAESPLGMDGAPLDLAPDYDAWLRTIEPDRHPERLTHGALLMVNGGQDHAVPVDCARETARIFRAAFAQAGVPERFRAIVIEDAGHALVDETRHWVMAWWYQWLLAPKRTFSAQPPAGHAHGVGRQQVS